MVLERMLACGKFRAAGRKLLPPTFVVALPPSLAAARARDSRTHGLQLNDDKVAIDVKRRQPAFALHAHEPATTSATADELLERPALQR